MMSLDGNYTQQIWGIRLSHEFLNIRAIQI